MVDADNSRILTTIPNHDRAADLINYGIYTSQNATITIRDYNGATLIAHYIQAGETWYPGAELLQLPDNRYPLTTELRRT